MNLFLPKNYKRRLNPKRHCVAGGKWQQEVYDWAMETEDVDRLVDVGCGTDKREFDCLVHGLDLPSILSHRFPDEATPETLLPGHVYESSEDPRQTFQSVDLESWEGMESVVTYPDDVVVCADVVEHLINPVPLIQWLAKVEAKAVFISTPDRSKLRRRPQIRNGPPLNSHHVQEWSASEFIGLLTYYGFRVRGSKWLRPNPKVKPHCFAVRRMESAL